MKEVEISRNWNILHNFQNFDNLKMLARKRTRWIPTTTSAVKLNFDGAGRDDMVTVVGVLWNARGEVLLAYTRNLGQVSNNIAEATTLI